MVKRALTLLTSILFALPLLMPFNIYGATWGDAPIIGININLIGYDYERTATNYTVTLNTSQTRWNCASSSSTMGCQTWISQNTSDVIQNTINGTVVGTYEGRNVQLYEYEIIFDKSYVGYIQTNWSGTDMGYVNNRIYVNGNIARFTATRLNYQFDITSYNLTYAPEEVINASKMFNIPMESYLGVFPFLNKNFNIVSFNSLYDTQYPIFLIDSNSLLITAWTNNYELKEFYFIFWSSYDIWDISSFNSHFSVSNANCTEVVRIGQVLMRNDGNVATGNTNIVKVKLTNNTGGNAYIEIKNNEKFEIMPIYFNNIINPYISTDFALRFGLSNQILDDLHIIANGTNASHSAAQSSDSANSQLQTDSNTLFQQENGFKSDMNNAMQNVNTTFRLQDMGNKFVSSAQWVRTQYENLTNNTPFASLITFSLITGLALILLGKVYK